MSGDRANYTNDRWGEFGMSARMLGFVVIGLMFTVSNLASGQEKLTKFRFV